MKFKHIIDDQDIVEVHTKENEEIVRKIQDLVNDYNCSIDSVNYLGYLENDIVVLKVSNIQRFYIENDKVYCSVDNKKYRIKNRLYQIEEKLNDDFYRINQSDIINLNYVEKFSTSIGGSIIVQMKNHDTDYVSRRMVKGLKKRMGL